MVPRPGIQPPAGQKYRCHSRLIVRKNDRVNQLIGAFRIFDRVRQANTIFTAMPSEISITALHPAVCASDPQPMQRCLRKVRRRFAGDLQLIERVARQIERWCSG